MSTFANFKKEGKIEGKIEAIKLMHESGFTIEQIAKTLKETEDFVKKAIASNRK